MVGNIYSMTSHSVISKSYISLENIPSWFVIFTFLGIFPYCLAFLPFCMQMVNGFSQSMGFIYMHLSKPKFIQVISDFKLLFNFHQT